MSAESQSLKGYHRLTVEKYVRRKNTIYANWRTAFTYPALDSICSEVLMRFGILPRWEEYVHARRSRDWRAAGAISKEHTEWRQKVRAFCLERGITTFPNQSAQFLKFYFAWYRFQYEQRHGKIERKYGRQMA